MHAIAKIIRYTHRHPANRALHCAGIPLYVAGLAMVMGHFVAGLDTSPAAGAALWLAAVGMFTAGHKIEGNLGSTTPVLFARLLARSLAKSLTWRQARQRRLSGRAASP